MKSPLSIIIWFGHFIRLFVFYLWEVLKSNLNIAYEILTPTHHMKPAIISVDVSKLTERQLLVAANMISMTPGTLSLNVTDDQHFLQIHSMYVEDPKAAATELQEKYFTKVCHVF